MASEVKANKISPATGTAVALGDSGDTFTVPSGATLAVAGTINSTGSSSGFDSGLASVQTFTSSGTWTRPSGITKIIVEVQAGGGGAGGSVGASTYRGGDGGGAGGYSKKFIDVSAISSETVTIGTGGSGGSGAASGSAGGTSSFGSHCSATGGSGGTYNGLIGPAAGVGSSGDVNLSGGQGNCNYQYNGGGGGSSVFAGAAGGTGGSSFNGTGQDAGTNSGSGGSSGAYDGNPGGDGGAGLILVEEYK